MISFLLIVYLLQNFAHKGNIKAPFFKCPAGIVIGKTENKFKKKADSLSKAVSFKGVLIVIISQQI